MKKMNKKSLILLVSMMAILLVAVGGTVAYLVTATAPVTNTFTPSEVGTDIIESFDGKVKSNVQIKNEGEVTVYVRAKIVANWVDASGNVVAPWTDNLSYNENDWDKGSDGYYYHKKSIAVGETSAALFNGTYSYSSTEIPTGAHHLVMDVIHQSVQAEPTDAVGELWGVTVAADGTISK